jgi:hypothetical protein
MKHGITSAVSKLIALKHNIGQSYILIMRRTMSLNDTSKKINLNKDSNESTSEGNNP